MSKVTENLARYVKEKGFYLSVISQKTGIPYEAVYDSLSNKDRDRDLRDWELIEICAFLEVNPMDFRDKPGKEMK